MMLAKNQRDLDDKHLQFIRGLPCLCCPEDRGSDPAHIRYADLTVGKPFTGRMKPDDCWTLPLCRKCHDAQHAYPGGEREYWMHHAKKDPLRIALALHRVSGDHEKGCDIVAANR